MRWIIRIIGICFVVVILVAVGLLLLPADKIARIASDQITARTGRQVVIEGGSGVTFWPVLGVKAGPLSVSNADWAGSEPMFQAEMVTVSLDTRALLSGEIQVKDVMAQGPVLRLSQNAQGVGNWEISAPVPAATAQGGQPATGPSSVADILPDSIVLENARILFEAPGQAPVDLRNLDLDLRFPDGGAAVIATLTPAADPVDLNVRVKNLNAMLSGAVTPLSLSLSAPGGQVTLDGQASLEGAVSGALNVQAKDAARLAAALGTSGGPARALQLATNLTYAPDGRLALRELDVSYAGNRVTGAADVNLSGKPQVTAKLSAGALDLTTFSSGSSGGSGAGSAAGDGWSNDPIDASALAAFDGTITLSAASVATGYATLGPSTLALEVENSRAVLKLVDVTAYGGKLTGQVIANNRKGLSVGGALRAADIELRDALGELAGIERFSGPAKGNLEFLGAGASMATIMNSLSGAGALDMGRGVIAGFDLDRLMRGGEIGGGTTVFDSLAASFTIQNGNLQNDDLLMKLAGFRADGEGRIGLGARDIDYLITPVALQSSTGKELSIPVRIRGPWANPSIRPDLSKALEAEIDKQVDKLEEQARDVVQEKLEKELGVTVEEGQDPEEVLKDALEDKAKDQLFKLLKGN